MSIEEIKMTTRTSSGTLNRVSATLEYEDGRIYFLKSPYSLKDEIKAMTGSRWHGYDEEEPAEIWSVEDCQRNRFQLCFLMRRGCLRLVRPAIGASRVPAATRGGVPQRSCHTGDMADAGLTYHYQIFGAEMGTGKTLAAQRSWRRSGVDWWWWVGPKTSLPNIKREFRMWGFPFDRIQRGVLHLRGADPLGGRVEAGAADSPPASSADESSRCKNASVATLESLPAACGLDPREVRP